MHGEVEVPLVMRRHGHHRTLAIAHEHVVGHPHFQQFATQRVNDMQAGGHATFFLRGDVCFHDAAATALVDERRQGGIALRGREGQRVFGGDGAVGGAHQGIVPGREHAQHAVSTHGLAGRTGIGEADFDAFTAADPVGLHKLDTLRPARQCIQPLQQLICIGRDAHVIHRDLALLDQRPRTPTTAIDDLFVGQYRLVNGIPVDDPRGLVDQAFLEHAQKQPLVPAIVGGLTRGDFAMPVDGQTEGLELTLHVGDVVPRPARWRDPAGHRRILRRQTEGVPAHRLQDVLSQHALVPRNDVADGVVPHMSHVQATARVGEHGQAVELLASRVHGGTEAAVPLPMVAGLGLDLLGVIGDLAHWFVLVKDKGRPRIHHPSRHPGDGVRARVSGADRPAPARASAPPRRSPGRCRNAPRVSCRHTAVPSL